jgi:hypothetical protein
VLFCFFQSSHGAPKVVISQPQEDLTKSGYKTSRAVENGGILLHVDEPLEPIS